MNAPAPTVAAAQVGAAARAARWPHFAALGAVVIFCVAWTLALGRDVHWDAVNYHIYLGYAALTDRFDVDFFAAGTPSYLNPYAYVPWYVLSAAGVPAIVIAVLAAALHALVLWFAYRIAWVAMPSTDERRRLAFALLAAAFAALNPIFLQWVGATAIDLGTGVLVVGAWLALASALHGGALKHIAIAGLLGGIATALKLSNAFAAIAAVAALLVLPGGLRVLTRAVVVYGAAGAAGFLALALPWSWQLWQAFGNPLFPFFNHWFASPDFTAEALRYERFLPSSVADFLLRPFVMIAPHVRVHTEARAADLRYAAFAIALVVWAVAAWRSRSRPAAEQPTEADATAQRVLAGLLIGVGVAWGLWLAQSGNSRYFLPMACVASAAFALVLQRLYAQWPRAVALAAALVVGAQVIQVAIGSDWRRGGLAWEGRWLPVDVPQRYRERPHLFLSIHFLSGSALLPDIHPDSGMINVTGFNVIGPGHPGGTRAQQMIGRNAGRVRLLVPLPNGYVRGAPVPIPAEILASHVARFGLRVDHGDCDTLGLMANMRGSLRDPGRAPDPWTWFLSCRLVPAPDAAEDYRRRAEAIDPVFDRVEDACPRLFHPRRPVTEFLPFPVRLYNAGSEAQLWVKEDRLLYFIPFLGGNPIDIGSVADWMQAPRPLDCSRRRAS